MASLSARERAALPDSAFASIGADGVRRLPIHDANHVRNALARFSQVRFDSDDARAEARDRLLKAARRHGIVPIGFIESQLRDHAHRTTAAKLVIELSQIGTTLELEEALRSALQDEDLRVLRRSGRSYRASDGTRAERPGDPFTVTEAPGALVVHRSTLLTVPEIREAVVAAVGLVVERERLDRRATRVDTDLLPGGVVTHLLTDLEASTPMLAELGSRYASVITALRDVIRQAVVGAGGIEVEARADEFTAVFTRPDAALVAAVAIQRVVQTRKWPHDAAVRVRIGVHTGAVEVLDDGYVGLSIHAAARVCSAGHGGQILTTEDTVAATDGAPAGLELVPLGRHLLQGIPGPISLFAVRAPGLPADFPPLRGVTRADGG